MFSVLFKIMITPLIFYWIIPLYLINDNNYTFSEIWNQEFHLFNVSFLAFSFISFIMLITFMMYLRSNREKSVAIVLSLKYLKSNYWKDVDKFFT